MLELHKSKETVLVNGKKQESHRIAKADNFADIFSYRAVIILYHFFVAFSSLYQKLVKNEV